MNRPVVKLLLHPTYFPNTLTFSTLIQHEVIWEVEDNYQKQTYRNRCYICTDRGKLQLTIPIKHVGGKQGRQKYKEVRIDNSYPWQRQHWRSIQTAYRTSPYFEYYEDQLIPIFEDQHTFLLDFNLMTTELLCEILEVPMPSSRTESYQVISEEHKDLRLLVNAKHKIDLEQDPYIQVFGDRHGFIKNLSTLDLIFNEGPGALSYLKKQNTFILNG